MSLMDSLMGLFGKKRSVDANVAANRLRQQDLHGQGYSQTADESAGTREQMEAELDQQRSKRTEPPAPTG